MPITEQQAVVIRRLLEAQKQGRFSEVFDEIFPDRELVNPTTTKKSPEKPPPQP
jgi:hypothetical protein